MRSATLLRSVALLCIVGASSSVVVGGKHARRHYAHSHRHHTHATTEHDADNTEEREGRHYTHAPLRGLPTHTVGIYADSCLERSDPMAHTLTQTGDTQG